MRISTRHTNQPEDDERFHRALMAAFEKLGPAIYFEHFYQAMTNLAQDYHPHLDPPFTNSCIHHFATRATHIAHSLTGIENAMIVCIKASAESRSR